jgi:hypothetical protein
MQRLQKGEKKGSAFGGVDEALGVRQSPAYIGDAENYQKWRHYHETNEWRKVKKGEQRQKSIYGGTEQ